MSGDVLIRRLYTSGSSTATMDGGRIWQGIYVDQSSWLRTLVRNGVESIT